MNITKKTINVIFASLCKTLKIKSPISDFSPEQKRRAVEALLTKDVDGVFAALNLNPLQEKDIRKEIIRLGTMGGIYTPKINTPSNKRVLATIIENVLGEKVPLSKIKIFETKVKFWLKNKEHSLYYDRHMHYSDPEMACVANYYFLRNFEDWLSKYFSKK